MDVCSGTGRLLGHGGRCKETYCHKKTVQLLPRLAVFPWTSHLILSEVQVFNWSEEEFQQVDC